MSDSATGWVTVGNTWYEAQFHEEGRPGWVSVGTTDGRPRRFYLRESAVDHARECSASPEVTGVRVIEVTRSEKAVWVGG
jgi:hypothetical protein